MGARPSFFVTAKLIDAKALVTGSVLSREGFAVIWRITAAENEGLGQSETAGAREARGQAFVFRSPVRAASKRLGEW